MSKKWNFSDLNQVRWSEQRKQAVHYKIMEDIDKLDRKRGRKHIMAYLTSCALFLVVLFGAYQLFLNEEQNPVVGEDEKLVVDENKEEINIQEKTLKVNDDYKTLRYHGTISSSEDYYEVAMTDNDVMYFIPVSTRATIDILQQVNFEYDFNQNHRIAYGLQFARSDIPLESYEIKDGHLHLYFQKKDLMNLRGSTGASMGIFSIHTFARNFSDQVTHYTAYGDGEPFLHEGEGFDLINVPLDTSMMYFPMKTHRGIFLQQQYNYQLETIETVLGRLFAVHKLAVTDEEIDLSMISLEKIEERDTMTVFRLAGDLNEAVNKNDIEKVSLKNLIIHGVGANAREQLDHDQVQIYLNDELLFEGNLSHIRINDIDDIIYRKTESTIRATLIPKASAALTHLEHEAWELLMRFIHPDKGLLFSPFANVDKEQDVKFTREEVAAFATDEKTYIFGHHFAMDNYEYEYTPKDFVKSIFINFEYQNLIEEKVPYQIVTFNQEYKSSGGIINNIPEAYPEGRYVEFFAPAPSDNEVLWQALRFVFEEGEDKQWYLVAIVRDVHSP
ncbi:hypothetical protein DS745_19900 [Anaerobacillus alkaliphilus]|uniref:Uncharacterized protein n=1 Tax=Anaerobacillus alkaliphilus TaxID=1548597 RepID=A0A4Q0VQ13_9BACI|nr:hypothetical protein [Anaerobacillus alkaliphilus]RXI98582.1 hypothetical protein DS745_19900 [Anaerobacillus alkaliphilus]